MSADRTPSNPQGLRDLPFEVPRVTSTKKKRAMQIYEALSERYPDAECALEYSTPHELLIATILSAQSTDVGVNKATPGLFKAFPKPADYAKASTEKIEPHVKTIGLYRNKSKAVHAAMTTLVEEFGGEVPQNMDDLLKLRGVARKTANVVLGNAFGINMGVVVDTHVDRVSRRFGLVPESVTLPMAERYLIATFPRDTWTMLSHLLIFHGRQACKARGELCAEDEICKRFCANAKPGAKARATTKKKTAKKKPSKKKSSKKTPVKKSTAKKTSR